MNADETEPRIAVYLDYENLAIGARDSLGTAFDFAHVADALAERGRVIVRKAYADWSYFDEDRRMLTRHQVELSTGSSWITHGVFRSSVPKPSTSRTTATHSRMAE